MSLLKKFLFDKLFIFFVLVYILSYVFLSNVMPTLFRFVSALILGGLIGYVTNMLAIWMLFNPKKKIFGIQGVIPKRKNDIAVGFANVIEDQLINHKSISNFLNQNRDVFVKIIDRLSEQLRNGKITLKELLGEKYPAFEKLLIEKFDIPKVVVEFLENYLNAFSEDELRDKLKGFIDNSGLEKAIWDNVKDKSLSELAPELERFVLNAFEKFLGDEKNIDELKEVITRFITENVRIPIPFVGDIVGTVAGKLSNNAVDAFVKDFLQHGRTYQKAGESVERFLDQKISDFISEDDLSKLIKNAIDKIPVKELKDKLIVFVKAEIYDWFKIVIDKFASAEISRVFEYYGTDLRSFLLNVFDRYTDDVVMYMERFFAQISFSDIVREKIEGFSVEEMEEMTLKLAKKELRYVEIFGIPLGMLIGLIQFFIV
uniref:DUF445 family protein n=2 Tax=Fervidobacterium pennivorans TaxID=93466 RepID=A0A7C4RY38_FERPE